MTTAEIVTGLNQIRREYAAFGSLSGESLSQIDAAIARLSATCATCKHSWGRNSQYCRLEVARGFDDKDQQFEPNRFACNQHTPKPDAP